VNEHPATNLEIAATTIILLLTMGFFTILIIDHINSKFPKDDDETE
jgi:hypothetical protein